MKREALLVLIACLLAAAIPVLAQSSAHYDLSLYVVASGGGRMAGTSYTLLSTAGQPVADPSGGDEYTLTSGFWGEGKLTVVHKTYLPLVQRDF
jgi:hypothetical protein